MGTPSQPSFRSPARHSGHIQWLLILSQVSPASRGSPSASPWGPSHILEGEGAGPMWQMERAPEWGRGRAAEFPHSIHQRATQRVQAKSH